MPEDQNVRHVCGISGGKDSAALAIYLKKERKLTGVEYFFTDTQEELPEVYDFLDKLEDYLDQKIIRIKASKDFGKFLDLYGSFLPSPRQRWCTREMKIKPFEEWIGDSNVITYVGIRADEPEREGYISTKPNIRAVFPFKEDGINKADVFRILEESVGVPSYYSWRSRSGCYFCFYQRRGEWKNLKRVHPDLFEKAKNFEKTDPETGKNYTWIQGLPLSELEKQVVDSVVVPPSKGSRTSWQSQLVEGSVGGAEFDQGSDSGEEGEGCLICHL